MGKWYNIRRIMREKTQVNSRVGYSSAYPKWADRVDLMLRCDFKR